MGASVSKVSISKVLHHNAAGFAASGSKKGEQPPMLSQSPIDIVENPTDELQTLSATETTLQLGAASAEMQLVHGGENFQVNWSDRDQNFLVLDGKKFYTVSTR
ncbi:hypothetical protein PF005_g9110 [Phytophthora fragariae]|uniref:Uncharacterized protein n=1 Tax=Phytophthora fragariae TaxID=53985 RepID=A0A6A3LD44_9STRA|nr:hypothetical protein PF003_g6777 [Phytophthora fragariae]KAE8939448.1 hypothetical protein PF009_g10704 [Phytophthora fragariae]KAE9015968.1 hypothetical protein PF011_g7378 [Phytophthora fragariae]KAE9116236.1 hypothetical protein PF007_g9735 [Phytophthora fragariae]KAE9118124.1 hypothetical protein PF010_g8334 [Phytophthora fragariae]